MRIKWTAVHFAVEANVATVSRKRSRQINGTHWLRQLVRAGARLTAGVIEIAIHNQNALPKALGTCARAGTKWNVIGHGLFQILGRLCGDRELCRRSGCKEEPAMFASEDSTPGLVSSLRGTTRMWPGLYRHTLLDLRTFKVQAGCTSAVPNEARLDSQRGFGRHSVKATTRKKIRWSDLFLDRIFSFF